MRDTLKLIAILFVLILVQSCQKEIANTDTPGIPPVITPHDSVTVLSRFIFIDYRVSNTDTMGYNEILYDDLRRVATISLYDYGKTIPSSVVTFYYNGNDTLAYKKTDIDPDPLYGYSDTHFYFYDNLNRLIEDSTLHSPMQVEVSKYNYSPTMIAAMISYVDNADPLNPYEEIDTGFVNTHGDIFAATMHNNYQEFYVDTLEYDTKPNPFYPLNIRSTFNPLPGFDFFLEDYYLQKNNVTLIHEESPLSSGMSATTFTYTYNASGLPFSVDMAYSFDQTDDYRIIFVYKKI